MKYTLYTLTLAALLTACGSKTTESTDDTPIVPALALMWESDTVLTTCESVLYDDANDILYVSNINGKSGEKDGNGFISKLTLDGKVETEKWVTGMDAPKGMGISNGKLYVADISRIHEIDIASGAIANTWSIDSAQFLNDITIDASGTIYISDTNTGIIYSLKDGAISPWLTGQDGINGLFAEGDGLKIVSFATGVFSAVDAAKQITVLTDSIENGDGIEAVGNGGYLVSSWNGLVHYVAPDGAKTILLDTRADGFNAADIEFIPEKNLLLVPTFFKNRVRAYTLSL